MSTTSAAATSDEDENHKSMSGTGQLRWSLLLVACLTAYTAVMIRDSYFYADDFLSFGFAHKLGLSWSLLSLNLFGHVAPTERLLHYVPLAISPFNYAVGEAIILIFYALLLLSFLWVLRELRVGTLVTLTLLFIAGTSTILLNATLYYDQTVFLLPASIFILCVIALFVRWTRTGQRWALHLSWLAFAVSFVTQERPLVVLVYLVLLRYVVLPYRQAPGGKRRWLSDWRVWGPFAVIGAAYVAYYLSVAPSSGTKLGVIGDFLRLIGEAFLRLVVGLPITGTPWVSWIVLAVVLLALSAALILSRRRELVLRATAFFIVCFLVNLGVVLHGVGGVIGVRGVADQVQYYLDSLFALGIAVGSVCSDWVWHGRFPREETRHRHHAKGPRYRWRVAIVCGAVVAIYVALLPFGISSIKRENSMQGIARSWMSNLQSSLSSLDSSRPATVIPLVMPASFVPGFESPYNYESATLPILPQWRNYDTGPVEITGPTGALLESSAGNSVSLTNADLATASVQNLTREGGTLGATCFQGNHQPGTLVVQLPHVVRGGVIAVNVIVHSDRALTMVPVSSGGGALSSSPLPASVRAGASRILATLPANPSDTYLPAVPVATVGFSGITPHAHFCITSLQVGAVVEHYGKFCNEVNIYGDPNHYVDCGLPWLGSDLPTTDHATS